MEASIQSNIILCWTTWYSAKNQTTIAHTRSVPGCTCVTTLLIHLYLFCSGRNYLCWKVELQVFYDTVSLIHRFLWCTNTKHSKHTAYVNSRRIKLQVVRQKNEKCILVPHILRSFLTNLYRFQGSFWRLIRECRSQFVVSCQVPVRSSWKSCNSL